MELRLKELLVVKNISISTLAQEAGITQANLSRIVNDKSSPNLETLQKIADALNIEIWELFTPSTSTQELNALIEHKGQFYKATTIDELQKIVEKLKEI